MHGVKRPPKTAATAEARAARKSKEAAKLASYLDIERTFFDYKRQARKDTTALHHTTKLLTLNPELYTVWNYRREVLLHLFAGAAEEEGGKDKTQDVFASLREGPAAAEEDGGDALDKKEQERTLRNQQLLEDDLMLTEHALRAHPKVYWIWNHRMWCLTQYPTSCTPTATWAWERELKLVEKMLDLDPRNFHGWNCRRAILQHLALSILASDAATTAFAADQPAFPPLLSHPLIVASTTTAKPALLSLAEKELAYTLKKIESNFSNFSAWHQRTLLLPHVWAAKQLDTAQIDTQVDAELELVKQAMYTDPSDQSVWFYHRWLVELLLKPQGGGQEGRQRTVLREEIGVIEELFELEPDSKWCASSLAHYYTALAELCEGEEAEEARGKAKTLLLQLIELDPDREQRYRDLLEGRAHF
ncbi:related to Rab geranylgeranyltransferase alpha subunit [Sporisorium reilianum f. sp. reilianum]|uniref:Geranylgeranyl transferase type-2 subunit alpha n=1 Tax=Sporisorium reilianum f. sp. reilianum TaxID=72559 RepID=A0A2N8UC40_9BASI|nr:related to Rab geranylgeranyltransferase alpha subunit [Sporisorium reilianum f. sp. reilianum]